MIENVYILKLYNKLQRFTSCKSLLFAQVRHVQKVYTPNFHNYYISEIRF